MPPPLQLGLGMGISKAGGLSGESSLPEYALFINAGQSNAKGYPEDPYVESPPTLAAGTYYDWDGTDFVEVTGTPNRSTFAGCLGSESPIEPSEGGYQNAFAARWRALTGQKVLWIQTAQSGSGVVSGVTYGGGNWADTHLATAQAEIADALAWLDANEYDYTLAGVLWQQGEADGTAMARDGLQGVAYESADTYLAALSAIADGFWTTAGSKFVAPVSGAKFFNILAHGGRRSANVNTRTLPHLNSEHSWHIWDVHQRLPQSNSRCAVVSNLAAWFGTDDRMWDSNVHFAQEAYNEIGEDAANNIFDPGSTLTVLDAPTGLTLEGQYGPNAHISWTNPIWTGARRIIVQFREAGDTWWRAAAGLPTTETECVVGIPRRGTDYEIRVGVWNDGGMSWSSTLEVTTAAAVNISTRLSTVGITGGEATAIEALWADLVTAGVDEYVTHFAIFKDGYYGPSGSTIYDLAANSNWEIQGTITKGTDYFETPGTSGNYIKTTAGNDFVPATGDFTMILGHEEPTTATSKNLMTFSDSQVARPRLGSYSADNFSLSALFNGAWRLTAQHFNEVGPGCSVAEGTKHADGSPHLAMWSMEHVNGRQRMAVDGSLVTPSGFGDIFNDKPAVQRQTSGEARIGRVTGGHSNVKVSVLAIIGKALDADEIADVHTAINDNLGLGIV